MYNRFDVSGKTIVVTGGAEPSHIKRLGVIIVMSMQPCFVIAIFATIRLCEPAVAYCISHHVSGTIFDRIFSTIPLSVFGGLSIASLTIIGSIVGNIFLTVLTNVFPVAVFAFVHPAIFHLRVLVKIC